MSTPSSPSIMRGNAAYSRALDHLNPYGGGGAFSMERANSQMLRALVLEQRTANLIAALAGDDVLILPGERAKAVAQVRKALGLPEVPEPEIVED